MIKLTLYITHDFNTIMKNKLLYIFIFLFLFSIKSIHAQDLPEVPSSINFGGVNVKFDRGAQKAIEEDIKSLMSNRKFWEEKMERAVLFFPIVESILMDEEVPIDFKYLAVQESSFKPDVVSSSKAVGYWQFKAETAIELNLRVDDQVDERKNIVSSTHAAAWYLKKNNQLFNNWVSTLYSYYLGAGGVKKLVPANWSNAREVSLTSKTDRYVLRFFAHKIALEAGIERFRSKGDIALIKSEFGKGLTLREIAQSLSVDVTQLTEYNKWFEGERVPSDREYFITVPVKKQQLAEVRSKLSLSPQTMTAMATYEPSGFPIIKKSTVKSSNKKGNNFYEINGLAGIEAKPGDSPKSLAKAGKISYSSFMKNNDLLKDMPIIPGNIYYLTRKNKRAITPFHVAHPGDTWQIISQEYGIRIVNLLKYNRTISRNFPIQTGQKIWLNRKRPRRTPIEIVPPKSIIAPSQEIIQDIAVLETTDNAKGADYDIPKNASGRKKYAPVLVEKSTEPASNVITEKEVIIADNMPPNPAATYNPVVSKPVINDRVVIISSGEMRENQPEIVEKETIRKFSEDDTSSAFESEVAKKPTNRKEPINKFTHIVSSGETYFSIARNYDMPVRQLLALNNRTVDTNLLAGEELVVDGSNANRLTGDVAVKQPVKPTEVKAVISAETTPTVKAKVLNNAFHVVESGQTYFGISRLYNLSMDELLKLNALSVTDNLEIGQKLLVKKMEGSRIPVTQSATAAGSASMHEVVSGETLYGISQMYNTTVDKIKVLNNLNSNVVKLGQKLKIPQ